PVFGRLFADNKVQHTDDEVLIVLTPRIVRMPGWTKANLRPLLSGTETVVHTKRESELRSPQPEQPQPPPTPPAQQQQPQTSQPPGPAGTTPGAAAQPASAAGSIAKIRFDPPNLTLKAGQTATVGVVVENVNDLFSIPLLLQYNPAVINVEEVQHGAFLSGGTQNIAIVSQPFKDKGQYIVSATRQPNTLGVNGSGTLLGLVVKGLAAGSSSLSIVQVNAKDSQQRSIPLVTSEATLQVQP
ncbi:MAG TPA: cohesin domain-containing protein, partial [Candidatus Dormibacteraeota bacterium]|nr:cohesin domain-containing protein [Candidatus Dormibacteraeota bacterium]